MSYKVDSNARYAQSHEWARVEGDLVVVGISDYAQHSLSDVVFVELPAVGAAVSAAKAAAVVESVKAAEDVISPISGEVVAINDDLAAESRGCQQRSLCRLVLQGAPIGPGRA